MQLKRCCARPNNSTEVFKHFARPAAEKCAVDAAANLRRAYRACTAVGLVAAVSVVAAAAVRDAHRMNVDSVVAGTRQVRQNEEEKTPPGAASSECELNYGCTKQVLIAARVL